MNNEKVALYKKMIRDTNKESPYIFVSYSKTDSEKVYPTVIRLQNEGCNIWIDKEMDASIGISWRGEVKDVIADRDCKGVLLFISEHSMLSMPVICEIYFSQSTPVYKKHSRSVLPIITVCVSDEWDSETTSFNGKTTSAWIDDLQGTKLGKKELNDKDIDAMRNTHDLLDVAINAPIDNKDKGYFLASLCEDILEKLEGKTTLLDDINLADYRNIDNIKNAIKVKRNIPEVFSDEVKELPNELEKTGSREDLFGLAQIYEEGVIFGKNPELAEKYYKEAAKKGHEKAQIHLGKTYADNGEYDIEDPEAIKYIELAAGNEDYLPALKMLSKIYGQKGDTQKSKECLKRAAEKGDLEAVKELGKLDYDALFSLGMELDKLADSIQAAAESGNVKAQKQLGDMYYRGETVDADTEKAVRWYKKAADGGDAYSRDKLAEIFLSGYKSGIGEKEVYGWILDLAKRGDDRARSFITDRFVNDGEANCDTDVLIEWIKERADRNDTALQLWLGHAYRDGNSNIEKNSEEAKKWYEKAADQGNKEAEQQILLIDMECDGIEKTGPSQMDDLKVLASEGHCIAQYALARLYESSQTGEINKNEAVKWYKEAARNDSVEAKIRLGELLSAGEIQASNIEEKIIWLSASADNGDPETQFQLGTLYRKGEETDRDYKKALEWYEKAADQGHSEAQFWLGKIYYEGKGADRDYKKAAEWFEKAANQKDVYAQTWLGYLYQQGEGVEQDYEKAGEWYEKAACLGHADAQYRLGKLYHEGLGVEQDYEKAGELYEKAAGKGSKSAQKSLEKLKSELDSMSSGEIEASSEDDRIKLLSESADEGNPESQFQLGILYYEGDEVEQDYKKAEEYFRKAAAQGNAEAQYRLGHLYYYGEGVEKNYEKAAEWYEKAAGQGDADAQIKLGFLYFYGEGVRQNLKEAAEWVVKAAEHGDTYIEKWLRLFKYGKKDEECERKALDWYKEAAKQKDVNAQFILGTLFFYGGIGVEQDYKKAVNWYEKAARAGCTVAQLRLGNIYYTGEGVKCEYKKAEYWFEQAADQKNARAQFLLGQIYFYGGLGIEQDYEKAADWFEKAADQGYYDARERLDEMARKKLL